MANILIVSVEKRSESAVLVQEVLTSYGCIIKTRLGIHENSSGSCLEKGLIILELAGQDLQIKELLSKLEAVAGVKAKLVQI